LGVRSRFQRERGLGPAPRPGDTPGTPVFYDLGARRDRLLGLYDDDGIMVLQEEEVG